MPRVNGTPSPFGDRVPPTILGLAEFLLLESSFPFVSPYSLIARRKHVRGLPRQDVLSMTVAEDDIREARVVYTIVGGKVVYEGRPSSSN